MIKIKHFRPTDSEIEILGVLWVKGPSTVRTVNEELNAKRQIGYTTTLKLMQIMTEKGMLRRKKASRTHVYFPVILEEDTKNALIQRFVDNVFAGSAMNLVMQALGNHRVSPNEIEMIKELIRKKEGGEK
jgi:BlaI family penicillinase repressor